MAATMIDRRRTLSLEGAAFFIAAAAAATLAGAWFFELVLGLAPCPLCLDQRVPYYVAIPLALVLALLARDPRRRGDVRNGFWVLALVLFTAAALGVYHAGIEWEFWRGPASCAAAGPGGSAGDILSTLKQSTRIVSCNEAAWRFLGLSLAGWNVLIAGGLAAVAIWSASRRHAT